MRNKTPAEQIEIMTRRRKELAQQVRNARAMVRAGDARGADYLRRYHASQEHGPILPAPHRKTAMLAQAESLDHMDAYVLAADATPEVVAVVGDLRAARARYLELAALAAY